MPEDKLPGLALPSAVENDQIDGVRAPKMLQIDRVMRMVRDELCRAIQLWPPMQSAHEGYAVIFEELEELWEHVKMNQNKREVAKMQEEAVQLAAMAARFVVDLTLAIATLEYAQRAETSIRHEAEA
jgi:hypothetical protein